MRPPSSISQRPTSAIGSSRPSSSLSRPSSAASHRTASRLSQRPLSRLSQRPSTRQSRALCLTLVAKLTGLTADEDDAFEAAYDLALRRIEGITKQAVSSDLRSAQAQLRRFSKKARIQCHEDLADALDITIKKLQTETGKRGDLDSEISVSKLPEHLQLLFLLAAPPSYHTLDFASDLLDQTQNPSAPSGLTWADILREEPFEGQHWEGAVGLPPGSVVGQEERDGSPGTSPTLSPVSDSELDDQDGLFRFPDPEEPTDNSGQVSIPPPPVRTNDEESARERITETFRLRLELEALRRQQYWNRSWQPAVQINRPFDLGDPSTLRPTFENLVGAADKNPRSKDSKHYINEHDAIREILISLQGRRSILFEQVTSNGGLPVTTISKDGPKLLHLTPSAQESILSKFARLVTILHRLRAFLGTIVGDTANTFGRNKGSRTLEAFAEALELQVIRFDTSMAKKEESMLRAHQEPGRPTVVSVLSLEKALREEFSDCFHVLLEIVCRCFQDKAWLDRDKIFSRVRRSPSTFSSRLLDMLSEAIQRRQSFGDVVASSLLMHVFLRTAEPVWSMLGRWLREGIFMPETSIFFPGEDTLPQEFFIESNGLDITDPDFWDCGYSIRSCTAAYGASSDYSGVPLFLRTLADKILGAGKSIGLLRILGHSGNIEHGKPSATTWPTFETFMLKLFERGPLFDLHNVDAPGDISPDNLSMLLSDHLVPVCSSAGKALMNILYAECDLPLHLNAIEDLFLSRKGDVLADFCDVLFSAIDSRKVWTDYHFLNTTFRETIESRKAHLIDPNLVRLTYKSSSKNAVQRSIKCFDGLTVEYAAPFPLVFVIGSRASEIYNTIFVMLIKIRRAKTSLDNILLRAQTETVRSQDEMKIFYAARSRLSWFVNSLLSFVCSHVLQVETQRFRGSLREAGSLDDIIDLHQKHLTTLEKLCFLDDETVALQRAIRSILDMSIAFSDSFVAFAGDTTLDTSHASTERRHRHRSRRQRRQRLNVVSFAPISSFRDDGSDSSESGLDESVVQEIAEEAEEATPSFAAPSVYESFSVDDFFDQNEKLMKDLDSRVRYIRREVERLASSSVGSQFDVFAFSLQDWDL